MEIAKNRISIGAMRCSNTTRVGQYESKQGLSPISLPKYSQTDYVVLTRIWKEGYSSCFSHTASKKVKYYNIGKSSGSTHEI